MGMRTVLGMCLLAGLALTEWSCSPSCDIERIQEVWSPDRRLVATVFVENCHATAPFVTAVNIRCATCKLDGDDYVFSATHTRRVTVQWVTSSRLLVTQEGGQVYRRQERWHNVAVGYEAKGAQ